MGCVFFLPGNTMLRRRLLKIPWSVLASVLVLLCLAARAHADLAGDANGLMLFKGAVDRRNIVKWNVSQNVCLWQGVQCSNGSTARRVASIRLPGLGLVGAIPPGSIGQLTELRVLSLRSNALSGAVPSDLSNCSFLKSVYLQSNKLSGPLPSDFTRWPNLVHLDFSSNNFSGGISPSLTNLTKLKSLFLQNNSFSGSIPPLNISTLNNFSVAYNQLSGAIPNTTMFQKFSQAAFVGNRLCGFPLITACGADGALSLGPAPAPISSRKRRKLSAGAIAGIVIGATAFCLFLAVVCFLVCCGRRRGDATAGKDARGFEARSTGPSDPEAGSKVEHAAGAPSAAAAEPERTGLVFFEGNRHPFDLEDLLRASAEVLGKGSVGTAYKAVLESGSAVAVKRLKDVNIELKEFEKQIVLIGKLRHENLVPMLAYYYSKEEKLLVCQFMTNGSLSSLLHGNKGAGRTPLDWDTRVRIALGAARGLDYLHDNRFTHGNIKSSNILLTNTYNGCVSDYGLAQLVSSTPAAKKIVGYRAPEVTDIKRVTQKADVYSFGVLLLELLTGKAPSQASLSDDGIDLPRWVQSVVREEWTAEVFDMELMRYQDIEEEMVQTLQIAMACVAPSPDQRPTMKQVVKMVQDLKKHVGEENGKEEMEEVATGAY